MSQYGPGDKPKVVRRRAARARRQQRVQQQTANARPLSQRPTTPAQVPTARSQRQTQQRAQNARPLSQKPVRPKQVVRPLAPTAKPPRVTRATPPEGPRDVRQIQRQAAVHGYDQLSGKEKRRRIVQAQQRSKTGKADESDRAILHIHTSRVAGKQKVASAVAAFNRLSDDIAQDTNHIKYKPGTTFSQPDAQGNRLLSVKGKPVSVTKPYQRHAGSVATLPSVGKVVATLGPLATKGLDKTSLPKIIKNIPKDAGELAVTSPTAVARALDVAVHHPKQALKEQAEPFKQLAKDPKKFIEDKPVTSALMLNPLARAPGRIVGKLARTAGKQTLRREVATLPGTALREERVGSRAAGRRAVQVVKDKRATAKGRQPQVTARQLDQRVDEAFAAAQHHGARVRSSMAGATKELAKEHPKRSQERADVLESGRLAAKGAVSQQSQRMFAREFGATAVRNERGHIVEHPDATEGHLHDNVEDARAVAEHLNAKGQTIARGHGNVLSGDPVGRVYAKDRVPVNYVVRKVGENKHVVVPEQAAQRLAHHQSVGSTQARGAKVLRVSRSMFTRAVLPYRPSWLSGQGVEGSVRAAIKQAGPTSFLRAKRYAAAKERAEPGSGKAFLERTSPAGLIGRHQFDTPNQTLHSEFPESNVARALTDLGKTPGIKQVRQLNHHVTQFVFNKVNAKFLEGVPQTAMLGKVLKDSPLMERKIIGLSNKALDEAVRNEHGTATQVQLLREVQKSYGKYEGYSPHIRELISHWTPFLPWYLNTAKFLLSTLPKDHPLATGLIANMDAATDDWRKQQGLSFRDKTNRVPGFMLGGYPISGKSTVGKALGLKKDKTYILRIGHYTPAGIGSDVLGVASGAPLPQFSGFYNALLGLDWKNEPLKHEDGRPFSDSEKFVYGLTQLGEAMVPLSGQASSVLGVPGMEAPPQDKGEALKKLIRPISVVERKNDQSGPSSPLELSPLQVQQIQLGG